MTSTSSDRPVAVLYQFNGSCWASVPRLTLIEKGYGADDCIIKDVDLLNAANFSPEYLKINTAGTVPTLVVPQLATAVDNSVSTKYTALTTSIEICEFLDTHRTSESRGDAPARSLAPASLAAKAASDELIALVHQDSADPNFLLLTARTEAELRANSAGLPGQFVRGRKKALEGYLAAAETQTEVSGRMENFLKDKLKAMDGLAYVLDNPTSAPAQEFLAKGQQHYLSVGETLLKLNAKLPREDRSGFVTLADLHVGGWFARILACAGAKDLKDVDGAFEALYKTFERKEDELVILKLWWSSMVTRKSFQVIYSDGLH